MRRYSIFGLLLVCVILTADTANAQQRLTFQDAINIALEKNINLLKAENQVELQRSNVKREKGDFLPNLNLSARPSRSWGLAFDQTSGQLRTERSDLVSFGANSGLSIFNGFEQFSSYAAAQHLLDADEYSLERVRQTVFFDVIQAYLQVVLNQEQVAILEEDVEAQRQQLTRIQEFSRLGARPISDLYQQEATSASSELQLLEAERALQISKVQLIQVLELDPLQFYEFDAPPVDSLTLDIVSYDLDELLNRSLESRLDRMAIESEILAAEQDVRSAKSGRYPSVTMSGSASTSYFSLREELVDGGNGDPMLRTIPFSDQLSDNRSYSVGFNVSVPIFNRFQIRNSVDRARIIHRNRSLDLQNLEQTIALEVRQGYLDYQTAAKRLDVTEKQLRSARQAIDVEQERYNLGASTLVELQQARASFVDAASRRAQAVFQFVFQSSVIDYYLGILNPQNTVIQQ